MKTLEDTIRDRLRAQAARAEPSMWARRDVEARVERAMRSRRTGLAIGAMVAATAAMVAAVVAVGGQGGQQVRTTPANPGPRPADEGSRPPEPAPPPPSGGRPHLALEIPGFDLVHVGTDPIQIVDGPALYVQVFETAPPGARLYLTSVPAGMSWGLSEGRDVSVDGCSKAVLNTATPNSPTLSCEVGDGTILQAKAWDLSGDELMVAAGALEQRTDGRPGWEVAGDLPRGLRPSFEGEARPSPGTYEEADYRSPEGGRATVRTFPARRGDFELRLLDRIDSATSLETIPAPAVLGVEPGALAFVVRRDDKATVLWRTPGSLVVEVVVEPATGGLLEQVIPSLVLLDGERWEHLSVAGD